MKEHNWAQVNIARMFARIDSPVMADVVASQKHELTNYI